MSSNSIFVCLMEKFYVFFLSIDEHTKEEHVECYFCLRIIGTGLGVVRRFRPWHINSLPHSILLPLDSFLCILKTQKILNFIYNRLKIPKSATTPTPSLSISPNSFILISIDLSHIFLLFFLLLFVRVTSSRPCECILDSLSCCFRKQQNNVFLTSTFFRSEDYRLKQRQKGTRDMKKISGKISISSFNSTIVKINLWFKVFFILFDFFSVLCFFILEFQLSILFCIECYACECCKLMKFRGNDLWMIVASCG